MSDPADFDRTCGRSSTRTPSGARARRRGTARRRRRAPIDEQADAAGGSPVSPTARSATSSRPAMALEHAARGWPRDGRRRPRRPGHDQPRLRGRPRRRHRRRPLAAAGGVERRRRRRRPAAARQPARHPPVPPRPARRRRRRLRPARAPTRRRRATAHRAARRSSTSAPSSRSRASTTRPASTSWRPSTLGFEHDQLAWASFALANLAYVETVEGNLPEALDAFASAEDGYRATGTQADLPRLYADHAAALADANLLDDAEHLIDRAVELSAAGGNDLEHAELLLVSAEIDLAKGKPDEAHVSAVDAVAAFTRQGRDSWLHVAERLRLRAEARLTPDAPGIAEGLVMNGRALAAGGWRSDALSSTLLAALLLRRARPARRRPRAARRRRRRRARGRGADQVMLGRVIAMLAAAAGDRGAARRAVTRRAARRRPRRRRRSDRSRRASHAAHHGAELIELGARLAIEDGRPRELLHRIEAMRTMVWRAPLVRAPDDAAMASLLDRAAPARARRRPTRTPIPTPAGPPTASGCASSARSARCRGGPAGSAARRRRPRTPSPRRSASSAIATSSPTPTSPATSRPSSPAAGARRCTTSATSPPSTSTSRCAPSPCTGSTGCRAPTRRATRRGQLLDEAATSLADQLLPATVARSRSAARRRADRCAARRAVDARWRRCAAARCR